MAGTTSGSGFPYGFVAVLALAALLYFVVALNVVGARQSDAAGNGLTAALAIVSALLLWVALAVLLLLARQAIPGWAMACLVVLMPLSAIAVAVAIGIHGDKGGWLAVVPLLLPVMVILYAGWARFASLQVLASADMASGIVVAALALGTAAPFVAAYV